ncbi:MULTISPECIES: SDR family NAD(P)-dependent oxidoreductase [Streptomyces]|nr:SDR family oxidoreductase [Streptomyces corchorusii]AEY89273.1 ketoacyl ACP/CoA reductase-like protein [Streptomyces hygroscopicus subsp. jinggangensis 5008]AGF63431.1 ketoacyl ACP/CoA reductase-like protein [Streptomyces hygroscopicus subsp. jinggangensis TL01]ALO93696.1 Ketoacyl ACP/CoA reductase-like protein [Streptomyces hygroscopicus subsp. limoneus]
MFTGKTVMITGASSGIGAATARHLAAQGAAVVLMARREEKLEKLAAEIGAEGGRALPCPGDVTSAEDVRRVVDTAVSSFGSLDAAFNNAGWGTAGVRLHELTDDVYDQIMDVNVRGGWNCMRYQIPAMLAHQGGTILNTSSTAGQFATGAAAPYVAAKHALIGLTRAAAAEYGDQGIRINALVVGTTRTELMEAVIERHPEVETQGVSRAIQRRMADPLEIARAAAWLLSEQSSFVTGAAVPVDGGCSAV